jgi:hypothetical protein
MAAHFLFSSETVVILFGPGGQETRFVRIFSLPSGEGSRLIGYGVVVLKSVAHEYLVPEVSTGHGYTVFPSILL